MLEKIDKEKNIMSTTKLEMRKAISTLNKLIIKKDSFKLLTNLVCNDIHLRVNHPMYCRV